MTMLDKCARAVHKETCSHCDGPVDQDYAIARAVLEALRDPSFEMVEAFWTTNAAAETVFEDPADLFRAMIDEALKERT